MSSPPLMPATANETPLQFESAEFVDNPVSGTCQRCSASLPGRYYQVDGLIACGQCAEDRTRAWNAGHPLLRLLKAGVFGLIGAALGFGLYYGVLAITGYEIGLISIVVGVFVGALVKAGSNNRGGWMYQIMAVFLTYAAIAMSYAAVLEQYARQSFEAELANPSTAAQTSEASQMKSENARWFLDRPWFVRVLVLAIPAAMIPFMSVDVLTWLIIGFALWSAFRAAARSAAPVSGPFEIAQLPVPASAASPPAPPVEVT